GGKNNGEGDNQNQNQKKNEAIILKVFMHCEGCAKEVVKCLKGFEGVEEIQTNIKENKVIVKGKQADPLKVVERLRKKRGKYVELISPIPKKNKNDNKKEENAEAKKEKVIEVTLRVFMHCESCGDEVKKCIEKMKGVQYATTDYEKKQVTVKGVFDPEKLVQHIYKTGGKHAQIVKKGGNEKKEDKQGEKTTPNQEEPQKIVYYYPPQSEIDHRYASNLFSDENANSCAIM
ncbi:Heavy metal-associated domain, HMA, partial [Dillenia turbinata]